jgi:hypothetical protein
LMRARCLRMHRRAHLPDGLFTEHLLSWIRTKRGGAK